MADGIGPYLLGPNNTEEEFRCFLKQARPAQVS